MICEDSPACRREELDRGVFCNAEPTRRLRFTQVTLWTTQPPAQPHSQVQDGFRLVVLKVSKPLSQSTPELPVNEISWMVHEDQLAAAAPKLVVWNAVEP